MKAHLINWSVNWGVREIPKIKKAKINPTPIATPAREINGMLDAKNLKPKSTLIHIHNIIVNKVKAKIPQEIEYRWKCKKKYIKNVNRYLEIIDHEYLI